MSNYINLTGISGIIGVGQETAEVFQNQAFGMRIDVKAKTWDWNPSYNSSITPNPYFYFGGFNDLSTTPNAILTSASTFGSQSTVSFGNYSSTG